MALLDPTITNDTISKEPIHGKMTHSSDKNKIVDIQSVFKIDFVDEIRDCNKYLDLASEAEELGEFSLAKGLCSIAWDEYTHAKFFHENLLDWGCEIPDKSDLLQWHELKERVYRKFCKS